MEHNPITAGTLMFDYALTVGKLILEDGVCDMTPENYIHTYIEACETPPRMEAYRFLLTYYEEDYVNEIMEKIWWDEEEIH